MEKSHRRVARHGPAAMPGTSDDRLVASFAGIRYIRKRTHDTGRNTMLQELQAPLEELKENILDTWRRL
ncbi:MAG: hypothetical protein ACQETQ_01285 [Spirochaetota bacterium]